MFGNLLFTLRLHCRPVVSTFNMPENVYRPVLAGLWNQPHYLLYVYDPPIVIFF